MIPKAKCRTRKIYHLRKKSNWQKQFVPILGYMTRIRKNKDKNVCENVWEKVIEKLEFIVNGVFRYF